MTLSDVQWTYMEQYVADMAGRLGLKDWDIKLKHDPAPEDSNACCDRMFTRRYAGIRLAKDWASVDADEQRNNIVHELIHVHLGPMERVVDDLAALLGKPAQTVTWDSHRHAEEVATDSISGAIASLFPACELPKETADAKDNEEKAEGLPGGSSTIS